MVPLVGSGTTPAAPVEVESQAHLKAPPSADHLAVNLVATPAAGAPANPAVPSSPPTNAAAQSVPQPAKAPPAAPVDDTPATATAKPAVSGQPVAPAMPPVGPDAPTRVPGGERVVAIGDLHGDITALRSALLAGQLIDRHGRWIGGKTIVVQTGDQIDRGDSDREVLDLLEYVDAFARETGGALYALNGNHEIMNAQGYLRYVTTAGFAAFENVAGLDLDDEALADVSSRKRARVAAFRPGGPYARLLARRNVVMLVGDTVFVHGGVLPQYATAADELNRQTRAWLRGQIDEPPPALLAPDGPLWSRDFAEDNTNCELLAQTLTQMSASRMVVGHTTQDAGINADCDGRVWRLDVGMSEHYGGPVQVLEIDGANVRVLKGDRWTTASR